MKALTPEELYLSKFLEPWMDEFHTFCKKHEFTVGDAIKMIASITQNMITNFHRNLDVMVDNYTEEPVTHTHYAFLGELVNCLGRAERMLENGDFNG